MRIHYDGTRGLFLLHTARMTYACAVAEQKLFHVYWGARLESPEAFDGVLETLYGLDKSQGSSQIQGTPYEYRAQEAFDYDDPSLMATFADGVHDARLRYVSHVIDGDTLRITLRDAHYPLEVTLCYRLYGELDLVSRWAVIRNAGDAPITLNRAHSATVHVPGGVPYRMLQMNGNWGAEYQNQTVDIAQSRVVLENHRVTCGAHQHVPFFALDARGEATETSGEVFYGVLHWSGDFAIHAERNNAFATSVTAGVNDHMAEMPLMAGEVFETPMLTIGFSGAGYERMTETLYDWQYDYLLPRPKAYAERPIIYNSWYPHEFDVHEGNMLGLIDRAAAVGAELFVIDDGWMPKRMDSRAGLGDWVADPARFPRGMGVVADACHAKGMLFGLWVEPEMVNPDSDLYRAHPDWVIADPTRPRTEQRNQLTLDLSREDVLAFCLDFLDRVIEDYKLDYLKWDMNRYVSEPGTDKAMPIRFIQNLYKIWAHLNEKYPHVLYENCASGGGRSDFGMVPFADRINRSDNADPVDVMLLHEGFTTLFVPKTAGGAGNIATSPNHVHGRVTPLDFRIHMGMTGSMSIGIDLLKSPPEERTRLREATENFKTVRADLQDAYVYRIASAMDHPYSVLQYVRRDRRAFGLFAFAHGMRHWDKLLPRFRMRGLIPDAVYVDGAGKAHRGDALMYIGLPLSLRGDYDSVFLHFRMD